MRHTIRLMRRLAALGVALAMCLGAGLARADPPAAPPAPASGPPQVAVPAPRPFAECISPEERAEILQNQKRQAFGKSAIPLPPLLYVSRDRTFIEALFLYWSATDVEEGSKLRLVLPFLLQSCTPKSDTTVTPLFGWRDDAEGRAGFIGPYFFRRDRTAETDVLFPFFFRILEPGRRTLGILNFYDHETKKGRSGALIPFAFWGERHDTGDHYTFVPPLFWRWGDRQETTTIAGLAYWRDHLRTPDWDFGLVPFYFGGRHADRYYDFVLPPLYWQWGGKDEHTSIALVPPGWISKKGRAWSAGAIPFYFGGRDGELYHDVVPPLLYGRWGNALEHKTWLLQSYYRQAGDAWTFFSFPFYFGSRDGKGGGYDVGFPLYWRFFDKDTDTGVAFQTYWRTTKDGWDAGSLPFWASGRSKSGWGYDAVLPPLYVRWGDEAKDSTLVLNTYLWRDKKGEDYDFAFFPLLYAGRHGQSRTVLSPLYLKFADALQSTTIIPPGYYHEESGKENGSWDFGLAPLVFTGARQCKPAAAGGGCAEHYTIVPPALTLHWSDERESFTWALLGYHHRTPEKLSYGAFPFFFRSVSGDEGYTLIPPLLTFDIHDKDRATTVVFNTYYRRGLRNGEGDPDDYDFGFAPLWFQGRHHGRRYTVFPFFPFWYDHDDTHSLLIAGPYYRHVQGPSWDSGVLPFYFGGRDVAKGKDSFYNYVPLALYFDWGDDVRRERTTIFPLGWRHREPAGGDFGIFPFFFSHDRGPDHFWLAPPILSAHWGDAHTENTIAALYYDFQSARDRHRGIFPLWASGELDIGEKEGSTRYDFILPPVYEHVSSPRSDTTIVLQSWLHQRRKGGWNAGSFPFYAGGRSDDGSEYYDLVLPPLFARWGDAESKTTIATLYYDRETRYGSDFGFAPLYFGGRQKVDKHSYYDVVPPLYWRFGDDDGHTTVAGLFYHRELGAREHFGLLPFYAAGRNTGPDGTGSYDLVLPPLFMRFSDSQSSTTVLLPGFYSHSQVGWSLGVVPFLFLGRNEQTGEHYTFVPPLFWQWGGAKDSTTLFLPLGWHRSHVHGSSTGILPFYFAGDDGAEHYRAILPPLYMSWGDGATETTVSLLYFNRTRPDGYTRGVIPFYAESRKNDEYVRMITPLYWQWGELDADRGLLFPLAYWQREGPSSLFLSPLVVRSVDGDAHKKRLVVFPFWWQFDSPDSSVNVGFPLWWDFKWKDAEAQDKRLSILAPLGFRYEKPDESTTLVLNTYYSRGKGKNSAAWSFHFFPLFSLDRYHADHFKWQALLGLVGREREDQLSRWKYLWFFWTDPS